MRYHLFALVHSSSNLARPRAVAATPNATRPALVEFVGVKAQRRVVAVIDSARVLASDEAPRTAQLLCANLARAFARRGLSLSQPELVLDSPAAPAWPRPSFRAAARELVH